MLLDLIDLRMHLTDQIVLSLRKLFDAPCHLMELFQHRVLARRYAMHPPEADSPADGIDAAQQ